MPDDMTATPLHTCSRMPAKAVIASTCAGATVLIDRVPLLTDVAYCPWCGEKVALRDAPVHPDQMKLFD